MDELASTATGMTPDQVLETIRYQGDYPTREHAQDVTQDVLAAFGRRLTGAERAEPASRLPVEAALILTAQIPDAEPPTGRGFVEDLASRTGAPHVTARRDAAAVLTVVGDLAGPRLLDRILRRIPNGCALLFARNELLQAA